MQVDLMLHQPPAEIRLRRLTGTLIQRETVTRCDECTSPMANRPRAAKDRAIWSTRIRDTMAHQVQVEGNAGSTDSLVLRAVRCLH